MPCSQGIDIAIFMILRNISWYISVVWLVLVLLSSAMSVVPEREHVQAHIMAFEGVCCLVFFGLGWYFMQLFRHRPTAAIFQEKWIRYGYMTFAILLTGLVMLGGVA